jgi:PD-(D/E)XK nuclease superfamily
MNTHHGDTEARSSSGLLSESLTETIIGAAIEVHPQLGPGLLESVYEECMCEELRLRGVPLKCQIELPVVYKGRETAGKYRIDLVVAASSSISTSRFFTGESCAGFCDANNPP